MIHGSTGNKVETIIGSSLGGKIDKEVNQDGSDKRCEEEGTLREVKRGRTALSIIMDG